MTGTSDAAMFIHLTNGGVLELFRLLRGRRSWTRPGALIWLTGFRRNASALSSLRRLLSERRSTAVAGLSDEDLIRCAANLICSGALLVITEQAAYRWNGPSAVLQGPGGGALLWRDGLTGVGDAQTWAACLDAINPESSPVRALRQMLPEWMFDPQIPIAERELLDLLRKAIDEGEIAAAYHWPNGRTTPVAEAPQYVSPGAGRSTPPPPESENDTFGGDQETPAQVGALQQAAASGTAFCEVCERLAAAPPQDPPPRETNTFARKHAASGQANTLKRASEDGDPFCEVCEREKMAATA